MIDTIMVSVAVTAGVVALAGVPLRCWQFATGRFRSQIPPHAQARATFSLFSLLFFVPNAAAWAYALYVAYRDFNCFRNTAHGSQITDHAFGHQPENALPNASTKRE